MGYTYLKLRTYSRECITSVEVDYEGQSKKLPLVLTPGDTPTLLGRKWLKQVQINWNKVFAVLQVEVKDGRPEQLKEVLEKNNKRGVQEVRIAS